MDSERETNLDRDILQARADIMRARKLVPPLGKPPIKAEPAEPIGPVQSNLNEPKSEPVKLAVEPIAQTDTNPEPEILEDAAAAKAVIQSNVDDQGTVSDDVFDELEIGPVSKEEIEEIIKIDEFATPAFKDFSPADEFDGLPEIETGNEMQFISRQMQMHEEAIESQAKELEPVIEEEEFDDLEELSDEALGISEIEEPVIEAIHEEPAEKQENTDIPRFNLAEQIMAEQRKFASQRRKRPGSRESSEPQITPQSEPVTAPETIKVEDIPVEPEVQPVKHRITAIKPNPADPVIARIVAKDIQRLKAGLEVF